MSAYGDNPALHAVTGSDVDEDGYIGEVEFTCSALPDAPCRTYPTCECEYWCCDTTPGHHDEGDHCCMTTAKPGQECWMAGWINNGVRDSGDVKNEVARAGTHSVTIEWDDGCYWAYAVAEGVQP